MATVYRARHSRLGAIHALKVMHPQVATSPELRERLGQNARKRFLEEYTADRMVRRYERIYSSFSSSP